MPGRRLIFHPGEFYHLYNRGNNRAPIFFERENYLFLLQRVRTYLLPPVEIVAYCLMPTHYHLLVRVSPLNTSGFSDTTSTVASLANKAKGDVGQRSETTHAVSHRISRAMMRLSVSYTKALNRRYGRTGVIFQGPFQAKHVSSSLYLMHLSAYIHANPVAAGLVRRPEDWEFSSFGEYLGRRERSFVTTGWVLDQLEMGEDYRDLVVNAIDLKIPRPL